LTIAGRCVDSGLAAELCGRLKTHPCRKQITWQNDYIAEADVPGLFENTDILVLPYRRIDQSGVLLQAFRFGLPIVATRVGAFEDYVTAERGELCSPNDVASLRAAVERLARRLEWQFTVKALFPVYETQP
jgi:glycosyltransferase involved in cell wall biosynthesis